VASVVAPEENLDMVLQCFVVALPGHWEVHEHRDPGLVQAIELAGVAGVGILKQVSFC
jgi:hypothetical protein